MNRSRKKPLRTYGRKPKINGGKQKISGGKTIKCVITNYSVQNITNYNVLVVNPARKYRNTYQEKTNLDIYNSSTERKFDLLIGQKPTSVFSSSNSSISSSEQKSGLKVSSLLSSLGSINENSPFESFSGRDWDKRASIVSPSDKAINSYGSSHFETKQVFVQVSRKVKKFRVSKRFSMSCFREKIGNSTPNERNLMKLKDSPVPEWGLSPIIGAVENDSSNLSNSPDIFESIDSDDAQKSEDDNHSLPKSYLKRNSVKRNINRRSKCHQKVGKTSNYEAQNDSVVSDLADLLKDQNLEENENRLSDKTSRTFFELPLEDGLDDQLLSKNEDISNELSLGLSMLDVQVLPGEYEAKNSNELVYYERECITDDSLVHGLQIDECCSKISRSSGKSSPMSKPTIAKSIRSSSSEIEHEEEEEEEEACVTEDERTFTSTIPVHRIRSKYSKSIKKGIGIGEFFTEHENSGDEFAKEAENADYNVSSKLQNSLNSAENFKANEFDRQEEDYNENSRNSDEKEENSDVKEISISIDEEEETYNYRDWNKKEEFSDEEVSNEEETSDVKENYNDEDFENKTVACGEKTRNVLDADDSLNMTGFDLENYRTFEYIPGKKYRRSLAALRQNKSSIDNNQSRIGSRRYSIIRPSAKLHTTNRLTLITTIEEDLEETVTLINVDEDKNSAKQQVLNLCNQTEILQFDSVLSKSESTKMKKIGEGVYGEVFVINYPVKEESIVFKIIPIEGDFEYNNDVQKKFHEIISEIYISKALSDLKKENIDQAEFWTDVYCNIIACNCFQGKYPAFMLDLWNKYHKENVSENDPPTIFPQDQLYISLKMSHGGGDIQNHIFASARQSYFTLMQVIFALAVAERALEFEHRDLHIGNVLVSKTKQKAVTFKIDGVEFKVPTHLRKATIIDYTLSRMNSENLLFYNDLGKDEDLFLGKGDLQFQVYRDMRDDTKNQWQNFEPKTNLRWIHYLAIKCIRHEYSNPSTPVHKQFIRRLEDLANEVIVYSSCHDYIMNSDNMIDLFHP